MTSIQNNTVTAVNLSGTVGGTSITPSFAGISAAAGLINVGTAAGNTIGRLTTAGAITISNNNSVASEVVGIYQLSTQSSNVSNNNVGGFTASNSNTGSVVIYGIRVNTGALVTNTIGGNNIGSSAAPVSLASTSAGSRIVGLASQAEVSCRATRFAI